MQIKYTICTNLMTKDLVDSSRCEIFGRQAGTIYKRLS